MDFYQQRTMIMEMTKTPKLTVKILECNYLERIAAVVRQNALAGSHPLQQFEWHKNYGTKY